MRIQAFQKRSIWIKFIPYAKSVPISHPEELQVDVALPAPMERMVKDSMFQVLSHERPYHNRSSWQLLYLSNNLRLPSDCPVSRWLGQDPPTSQRFAVAGSALNLVGENQNNGNQHYWSSFFPAIFTIPASRFLTIADLTRLQGNLEGKDYYIELRTPSPLHPYPHFPIFIFQATSVQRYF